METEGQCESDFNEQSSQEIPFVERVANCINYDTLPALPFVEVHFQIGWRLRDWAHNPLPPRPRLP